jgi:ABC-type lipoprotein release transport system permease subunit
VQADRLDDVGPIMATLKNTAALADLEILPWDKLAPELVTIIDLSSTAGWFVLIIVLIAAVAGIANTLMMATYERMHEFGMLLALGCRPGRILRLILVEAVLLGALGVAAGSAAGIGFVRATHEQGIDMASWGGEHTEDLSVEGLRLPLQIKPRLETEDPFVGLAAVVLVSLLAAAWPASTAARLDPMEAMRA